MNTEDTKGYTESSVVRCAASVFSVFIFLGAGLPSEKD